MSNPKVKITVNTRKEFKKTNTKTTTSEFAGRSKPEFAAKPKTNYSIVNSLPYEEAPIEHLNRVTNFSEFEELTGVNISFAKGKRPEITYGNYKYSIQGSVIVYTIENTNNKFVINIPGTCCMYAKIETAENRLKFTKRKFPRFQIDYVNHELADFSDDLIKNIKRMYNNNKGDNTRLIYYYQSAEVFAFTQYIDKNTILYCSIADQRVNLKCFKFEDENPKCVEKQFKKDEKYVTWINGIREYQIRKVDPANYGIAGSGVAYPGTTFDMRQEARKLLGMNYEHIKIFHDRIGQSDESKVWNDIDSDSPITPKKYKFNSNMNSDTTSTDTD